MFVCGTDFGENATRATEIAARLAAKAAEPLVLVHALQPAALPYLGPDLRPVPHAAHPSKAAEKAATDLLTAEAARLAALSGANVVPRLAVASPDAAILEAAAGSKNPFIITGTHGRTAPGRWILGSTADRLVRRSNHPVLVVRDPCEGLEAWSKGTATLRVLAGVSFDASFDEAAFALKAVSAWGPCDLHFAHTHEPDLYPLTPGDAHAPTAQDIGGLAKGRGLEVKPGQVHLLGGAGATIALVEEAKRGEYGLVVVGTHGRRGLERTLLGSVALGVLHRSPCPVLIAPVL